MSALIGSLKFKFSCLATKHQIGVTNVSIGSIDNGLLNAKCITNTVLLRTCLFGKIGNL